MLLLDLADACRASGLPVEEIEGWRTRGHGQMSGVNTIVPHHTATPASVPGNYPSLRIVRDGTVYVIAAGVAYHAGATFYPRQDNWHAIGIEAEHDGVSPWTPAQYDAYVRLVDALRKHYGIPLSNVQGHKEIAKPIGRKIDPTFDMPRFRADVAGLEKRQLRIAKLEKARARKAKWQRWVARANKNIARLKDLTK